MLTRVKSLLAEGKTFAFETTLATKSYGPLVKEAQQMGYEVSLFYFWLSSPELAEVRVRNRVAAGGHNIPVDVIHRRYRAGIRNLFSIFMKIVDYWVVIDSSNPVPSKIAEGKKNLDTVIFDSLIFEHIASYES